ncbi:MAG: VWA domain-containing protein [Hyphomicrobiaceae bacterium]
MTRRDPGRSWNALAWAAFLLLLSAGAARADDPASVIVVFDGSGSMAGNIEGTRASKVILARDAVRRGLTAVSPRTRVGLVTFGNRRGDCGDVDVVRRPEPLDAARLMDSLDRLNPRGRGPLTHALREAAKAFPPGPGRRSIILLNDDIDNCQQNVCAAGEELRRAGIVAHIVGLALKPDDAARMACLPQVTGGRSYNARTPEQLNAFLEEALRFASTDAGRQAPQAVAPPGQATSPAAIPPSARPGLYLRAALAPGAAPVALPLQWTVRSDAQPANTVFSARTANPHVPVPPGRYMVEARDGTVVASQMVDVAENKPTEVQLILNAGTLQVRAMVQRVGAPLGDAIISVAGLAGDGKDSGAKEPARPIAVFKGGEAIALLSPGRYLVRAEQGLVRGENTAVVQAGSQGRIDIALNAARIMLTASGQDTAAGAEALMFSVDEDDPDAPKGRREVARSAARQGDFVLPPGTYYVAARQGGVEVRESLAVGPGDVARRTLSLAAGRLALATKPAGAGQAPSEPVSYRIERLDGAQPEQFTTSRPAPTLLLPAGRYRVDGRYGAMNARVSREVEVKAGQLQQITLEPQAATLKLRLAARGAPVLADVFWDIRDETGVTVWTTGLAEPAAVLRAGRYTVRAETRDKRYDRTIELRAGESRLLELAAD